MKRLSLFLLLLVTVTFTFPATGQVLGTVSDSTCTSGTQCAGYSGQGCNSTTFTLTQTHQVSFCAAITCDGIHGKCEDCLSVSYLYDRGGSLVDCIHSTCQSNCGSGCTSRNLAAGEYILYSCLLTSGANHYCVECNSCVATATVSIFP